MSIRLPQQPIIGAERLREAAAGDFQSILFLIRAALTQAIGSDYVDIAALYPDSVVVWRDGRHWRYAYALGEDNKITLAAPAEVVRVFAPVGEALREAFADSAVFLEADAKRSGRFAARVIRAGLSGNNNYYPDQVLREAVPLFAGARVFVKSDSEHIAGQGKDLRNLVGRLVEPDFRAGACADQGEIRATLELIEPEGAIGVKLREAVSRGMTDLFGLSVDVVGPARMRTVAGRTFREALKFTRVASVDLIVEPGAGGAIINFVEAQQETTMTLRDLMLAAIRERNAKLLDGVDADALDDAKLEAIYREALAPPPAPAPANPAPAQGVTPEQLTAALRMVEARAQARSAIAASALPKPAQARLSERFEKAERFTEAEVDQAIAAEREYLAQFADSGRVTGLGETLRIESGETRAQKTVRMLEAFFDPAHKDHRHAASFKDCYVQMTGDSRVTGMLQNCDQALMREALDSASWANVLGNSITRRLIADYREIGQYDVWRRIVGEPVPLSDFRSQERTRWGGYGDLPIVAENGPYGALASPTDEKATYAPAKRGGTEQISLEMIKNDDVGAIRRIPVKLSRSAKRTLAKFVLDFIRLNPLIYDGIALFHATHANLGASALSAAALAAARLSMLKQTELNSADRLGIGPRSLLVPPDLEEAAVDLFRRNTNNDKNFVQSLVLDVLPVWYWTDVNDWAVASDPMDLPTIEVGFLDNQQEPELFVQDNPTVGSLFTNDQVTWKIRHIYGAAVLDFRGLFKAVV